jgi:hypothetical protein
VDLLEELPGSGTRVRARDAISALERFGYRAAHVGRLVRNRSAMWNQSVTESPCGAASCWSARRPTWLSSGIQVQIDTVDFLSAHLH